MVSASMSTGKTTALKLICLGQGCPVNMIHPLVVSGGNMRTSGSST